MESEKNLSKHPKNKHKIKRKGAITMKSTNKKIIVKFAVFVILFITLSLVSNYVAGRIMDRTILLNQIVGAANESNTLKKRL